MTVDRPPLGVATSDLKVYESGVTIVIVSRALVITPSLFSSAIQVQVLPCGCPVAIWCSPRLL